MGRTAEGTAVRRHAQREGSKGGDMDDDTAGRRRRYFTLMGISLSLFILAATVIRLVSPTLAAVVAGVAMVIPPFAAIVANARWRPEDQPPPGLTATCRRGQDSAAGVVGLEQPVELALYLLDLRYVGQRHLTALPSGLHHQRPAVQQSLEDGAGERHVVQPGQRDV